MGLLQKASLVITPNAVKAGKLYSVIPNNGTGDLDVVRATSATRVNSAGLIETVGNNIARLDYTNGSCPSILVEPQRTNLNLYSDNFGNSYWSKFQSSISNNVTTSPDGTTNAYKLIEDSTNNFHSVFVNSTIFSTIGVTYTRSVYAKADSRNWISLLIVDGTQFRAFFDLKNGVVGNITVGITASIESVSNGWYRCSITRTASTLNLSSLAVELALANGTASYLGNGTSGVFIWGAQLELGSNVTSYIPTTTSSVTRNADIISKTGISYLIGQTEGTFYSEIQFFEGGARFNGIELFGNIANRIYISKDTNDLIAVGFQANSINTTVGIFNSSYNKVKIAIRYKSGNSVVYVNGVNVGSSSAIFNFTAALTTLNCNVANNNIYSLQGRLFSCAVFPAGLTDLQLQKLTTL